MSSKRVQKTDSTKANWFETSVNGGVLLLGVLQDAAGLAPVPYLKQAAGVTLKIIEAVQQLKDNKADFRRLAQDATELIATIFDRYKNSPDKASWPPPEIAQIISELLGTLTDILHFVEKKVHKKSFFQRFINNKADGRKVKEYRERLQAAVEKFQSILKIASHLNLNESVALILKKLNQQEQQAGSHPTPFEEASEVQSKIEADRRRKEEMEAKAAEERHRKEIEAKQREVAASFESIRRAEAKAQEYQKGHDEIQRLRAESELLRHQQAMDRQQAELDEQRGQCTAEEEARKEYAGRGLSSTTPIRADSAVSGSTNADSDPVVLDQAYKRYEGTEKSYLSKPEPARKGKKSKVEDYDEEGSDELVNDSSEIPSTDKEERERRRRQDEQRRRLEKKAASKKIGPAGQTANSSTSPSLPTASTPQSQHHPFQQPPVLPYSPPPSRPSSYPNPVSPPPVSLPPPGPYPYAPTPPVPPFLPHGGYFSPPPGTLMYNSGNYSNNIISNVGNDNSRTVITPRPRRATRRTRS
ncbi:hypothetical protein D9613_004559 [Agrocybe pediades]|uniref:Uncharacterized protein n=1 Tax=Agrocybe pediades TaxID=84607 RepID=A0A8H4VJD1_9AGAR|nr:hypothetical protein D9613_004559 [Agrocybe pediades]